jgi:hypothetical protein
MILPEGDDELVARLVDDGVYDEDEARVVVQLFREGGPID